MKTRKLILPFVSLLALSSCATNIHHDISEYILEVPYTDNFKILQLSDTHMGDKDDQELHYRFMQKVVDDANPNMIIVTGDVFTFASKSTIKRMFNFLDKQNVPWTVTWGNHDEQIYTSMDWMTGYLNNYGHNCVFYDHQDDDVTGNANFAINLMQGTTIFEQLIIMDSNRYHYGFDYNGYDYFKPNQIKWYSELVDYTTGKNGGLVDSLMFYHIPLPEIDLAYLNGSDKVGQKNEDCCPPKYNSGFFKVIKEKGSTKAMFFGHDHINDFVVEYEGVTFCYGLKSTDRIYCDENMLGGKLITIKNDHSIEITNVLHKYSEVM